eukprot:TRINITY_DN23270_c0_g2_i1.p1 TRINITY_DN23270_c0_g2~~TRINITY_DN23270_c0_g2_i1.p1  ORF type:complete len:165 (+),score=25.15 TRINITY_DN23270_c0_g2_i1:105-599(+)
MGQQQTNGVQPTDTPRRYTHITQSGSGFAKVDPVSTTDPTRFASVGSRSAPQGRSDCDSINASLRGCCCKDANDGSVEDIIVVHHDAFNRLSFLMKFDELSAAELPSVPQSVVEARRAEMQRCQANASQGDGPSQRTGPLGAPTALQKRMAKCAPPVLPEGRHV